MALVEQVAEPGQVAVLERLHRVQHARVLRDDVSAERRVLHLLERRLAQRR